MSPKIVRPKIRFEFVLCAVILLAGTVAANAQEESTTNADAPVTSSPTAMNPSDDSNTLKTGDNEFGFWGGGLFEATSIGGLGEYEARDRRFALGALHYGRTLAANDDFAFQYIFEAVPVAMAHGDIVQVSNAGSVTTFKRETAYGGGLTPLGFQLDFRNGSSVHPFVHVNGGVLYFNKPVPMPYSGKFAFVGQAGAGVRMFTSDRRAVMFGVIFHHISNGGLQGANGGLNQFVFYGGFSVFK